MKNILLLVHDDPGQEARFQAALDLTRALAGHLICLDLSEIPIILGDPYGGSLGQAQLLAELDARQAADRARMEARLAREGVAWTWLEDTGGIAPSLKDAAGMADIIVVNRQLDSAAVPDMRGIAAEVVIGSGRLVAAVPERARGFEAAGVALVAWDGSDEATNALHAAVPLLQLARTVTLVEIADGSIDAPAEEAASYLSRHGIKPVVVRRRPGIATVSEILLDAAKAEGADYVVMGGFGHSRIAEALFGGASRDMLTDSPIPMVMAH